MDIIFTIIKQAKQSAAFSLYCALLAALCLSVIAQSGSENVSHLLIYACSLVLSYLLFHRLLCQRGVVREAPRKRHSADLGPNRIADGLLIASALFILLHFAYLGHVPLVTGMLSNDYFDIMRIRQSVFFEAPAVFRYPPNIILKSLLPFLLLYYYVVARHKSFWLTAGLATFYGLALMNKMFVIIEYAPLMLYLLFNRRFYSAAASTLVPVAALALLVFVQNPQIRPALWTPQGKATTSGKPLLFEAPATPAAPQISQAPPGPEGPQVLAVQPLPRTPSLPKPAAAENNTRPAASPLRQFVETIYLRVFVVPGQVISVWFSNIPKQLPFANGCGYRVIAALRGCEFRFYPALVHDIENPRLVAEGVHGTMTAASFMEDYANFGIMGLVLGGVLLAFLLALITRLFANDWRWALVLNFIPIAMMVELPLSTVLLTGGWASTLLLYPLFRERLAQGLGSSVQWASA